MTIRVALIGSTGYTAQEVARLIHSHPEAVITAATGRADAGKQLAEVHHCFAGKLDVVLETLDPAALAAKADLAMCCLPHAASAATVRQLVECGMRVIDFSADFRLSDVELYEQWYDVQHPWPERIGNTVYGMPEFFASEIRKADVVANPGCYPTSAILPLAPLVEADLIDTSDVIIDSKSGVSGAGRSPKLATLYCETNESIAAYAVASHRHQPEIGDLVHRITGREMNVLFTPHLTPMQRGILSTIYVRPRDGVRAADLSACWERRYADSPFITSVGHLPASRDVAGTNHVQIAARDAGSRVVIVCVIDNLLKGASGAAVQNMNVMFGLDEACGLG